jgi:hypothetical protein
MYETRKNIVTNGAMAFSFPRNRVTYRGEGEGRRELEATVGTSECECVSVCMCAG